MPPGLRTMKVIRTKSNDEGEGAPTGLNEKTVEVFAGLVGLVENEN